LKLKGNGYFVSLADGEKELNAKTLLLHLLSISMAYILGQVRAFSSSGLIVPWDV